MVKEKINQDKLHLSDGAATPSKDTNIKDMDGVTIQVTQVYCPNGHNLIDEKNEKFFDEPGIGLLVSAEDKSGVVYLSPFHGDHTRKGFTDFPEGSRLKIACPICKTELPRLSKCACKHDGDFVQMFLTPKLDPRHVVALCNVWGCHQSKVFDQAQLLSAYSDE